MILKTLSGAAVQVLFLFFLYFIKKCTMYSLFCLYCTVKLLVTWTLGSLHIRSHQQLYHPPELIRELQIKPFSPFVFFWCMWQSFFLFDFCRICFALQKRHCKTSWKKAVLLQVLLRSSYKKTCQQTKLENHLLWKTRCSAANWNFCRHCVML